MIGLSRFVGYGGIKPFGDLKDVVNEVCANIVLNRIAEFGYVLIQFNVFHI